MSRAEEIAAALNVPASAVTITPTGAIVVDADPTLPGDDDPDITAEAHLYA